ncbi:ATP-binding protein [Streptomyces sp. PTM05]|uniref:ATP-binding protein n=1 Tax=Streptantibioticus parmotrematis TaxID=2873249 RepID=A0ABS7QV46_9ACTN|nr:ATP-binding protein [Streptantibioticus parmotrematis]
MRQRNVNGLFPVESPGASNSWRGVKEVAGVAFVVAEEVPTSSAMALPHGPAGVGHARRRLREELCRRGAPDTVVDDAVLIISELLSNACRHGRPIDDGDREPGIRAAWRFDGDGLLTLEVTDGGGPTRPLPSSPSLTARGGRGLGIVGTLSLDWGVKDAPGEVTVWAVLPVRGRHARREGVAPRGVSSLLGAVPAEALPEADGFADAELFGTAVADALPRFGGFLDDLG